MIDPPLEITAFLDGLYGPERLASPWGTSLAARHRPAHRTRLTHLGEAPNEAGVDGLPPPATRGPSALAFLAGIGLKGGRPSKRMKEV